ncbi:MAG: hypothetical protein M3N41_05800 [Acidobacteriota bacterium]|nr:hypothetical protein [Acidobacteriota bacterium]
MPNRSGNRGQGPKDANQIAFAVVQQATGEVPKQKATDPTAVTIGRAGGLKGGKARAESLTAAKRKEIAKKAATERWSKAKLRPPV